MESEDYRDILRCAARLKILVTCPSLRCLAKAYTSRSSALSRAAFAESSTDIAQLSEGRTRVGARHEVKFPMPVAYGSASGVLGSLESRIFQDQIECRQHAFCASKVRASQRADRGRNPLLAQQHPYIVVVVHRRRQRAQVRVVTARALNYSN